MKVLKAVVLLVAVCTWMASGEVVYFTDFSEIVAGDADGKVLPYLGNIPDVSVNHPHEWCMNNWGSLVCTTNAVTNAVPPAHPTGGAAARVGYEGAMECYIHITLTNTFAATDYEFSFGTRLAKEDGESGADAIGQMKLSVGYVNEDGRLDRWISDAAMDVWNVSATGWRTNVSQLAKEDVPLGAIGKRIHIRLQHNAANTDGYFSWVDHLRIATMCGRKLHRNWSC